MPLFINTFNTLHFSVIDGEGNSRTNGRYPVMSKHWLLFFRKNTSGDNDRKARLAYQYPQQILVYGRNVNNNTRTVPGPGWNLPWIDVSIIIIVQEVAIDV
jgi:hypothetical protein